MAKSKFSEGQRWSFKPAVENFESSFVIAAYNDWSEPEYSVYVQFTAAAREKLAPGNDGTVLVMTPTALKANAHRLLESDVKLPWWWQYGQRFESEAERPNSSFQTCCDILQETLPNTFLYAQREARLKLGKQAALDRHKQQKKVAKKKAAPSKSIQESWERLAAWYAENAPEYSFFKLNPGASKKKITAAEKTLGVQLPDDFKESLQIHNGGDCWIQPYYGELLSLEQIVKQWKMYRQWQKEKGYADPESDEWQANKLRGPAKKIFWNTKRIYVTDNSGGHLTLDLDPPREGKYGQVIAHDHEVGPTKVVASSWTEFLLQLVKDHESGKYVYVPEEGSVCLVKDLKKD